MLQIRGPILPERLIPQKDMEKVLRQAVEEESDLAGIHFEGGIAPAEALRIISLKECRFTSCRFGKCKGEQLYFLNVEFESCDFSSSFFDRCLFRRVRFINCKLSGALFSDSSFEQCIFENSPARMAAFPGQDVRKSCFLNVTSLKPICKNPNW